MRITNGILARETVSGFQAQMRALDEARRQASSGVRVQTVSDDPTAAVGILHTSSALRALEQHRANLDTGRSRLDAEDSVLDQLGNVLTRAKEIAAAQASDTSDGRARRAAHEEVEALIDFVADLGNTRMAGVYIFGGQYADRAPFQDGATDPAYPPSGSLELEIGVGARVPTTHGAQEMLLDSGVMEALTELSAALDGDDVDGVRQAMDLVDDASDQVRVIVGELGARMNQLEVTASNLESLEVTLNARRSDLADADLSQVVTELVSRQGSLEAAMLANSNILKVTLADYLR